MTVTLLDKVASLLYFQLRLFAFFFRRRRRKETNDSEHHEDDDSRSQREPDKVVTMPVKAKSATGPDTHPPFTSFLFGYGSLICPISRAVTAPSLASRTATPVVVRHLERHFSMPVNGWIAMGVRFKQGAECVGVLLPVTAVELKQFDRRELGYHRFLLKPEQIEPLNYTSTTEKEQQQQEDKHSYFQYASATPPPRIWVYIQTSHESPSARNPIAQSYVDIILRGCLSISHEFARLFLVTTQGWILVTDDKQQQQQHGEEEDNDNSNNETQHDDCVVVYWVDDRHDPLYIRADAEFSKQAAQELDQLLATYQPRAIKLRRPHYGKRLRNNI